MARFNLFSRAVLCHWLARSPQLHTEARIMQAPPAPAHDDLSAAAIAHGIRLKEFAPVCNYDPNTGALIHPPTKDESRRLFNKFARMSTEAKEEVTECEARLRRAKKRAEAYALLSSIAYRKYINGR